MILDLVLTNYINLKYQYNFNIYYSNDISKNN